MRQQPPTQLLDGRHHVRQAAAEAVEAPDADDVLLPRRASAIRRSSAGRRSLLPEMPSSRNSPVTVHCRVGGIGAELEELVVDGLGIGTDTAVDRSTHDGRPPGSGLP